MAPADTLACTPAAKSRPMDAAQTAELVQRLRHTLERPDAPCAQVETHISHVLLCGEHAYKLKKPVDLGFLDFSTLERRREFCNEELRLNQRLAAELYLGVVAVTGPPEAPRIGGEREVLEWAVHMRRFDAGERLDRVAARGELDPAALDDFARRLGEFHLGLTPAGGDSDYGSPTAVARRARENFDQILQHGTGACDAQRLHALRTGCEAVLTTIGRDLQRRRDDGFIRECHGDLHLANLVRYQGRILAFDALEFAPDLRWIDVISELAFLHMDLQRQGLEPLAWRLLDRYLSVTGDYAGLALLPLYLGYRAMVRAKVSTIEWSQARASGQDSALARRDLDDFLRLAEGYQRPRQRLLILTHGPSGCGKSWWADRLLQRHGLVRLRSDVERKRLLGLTADATTDKTRAYDSRHTTRTYDRLLQLAEIVLRAGLPLIVDAAFLHSPQRQPFLALARHLGVTAVILAPQAAPALLAARIAQRQSDGSDPSEADIEVMRRQLDDLESLSAHEAQSARVIDPTREDIDQRLREIFDGH